ncbi:hypothetical protein DL96DRAFT_1579686 [Flagelloscypha sp. PMI_526]|nr:hypothetical protein DL96DRAFT_1579686 [Flagelloscypha sp. PMI_526]
MDLPTDIIFSILAFLDPNQDVGTLWACSMVSSSFRTPAQIVLFSKSGIKLKTDEHFSRFQRLIHSSPHLRDSVKILSLETNDQSLLVDVLSLLPAVTSLTLSAASNTVQDLSIEVACALKEHTFHTLRGTLHFDRIQRIPITALVDCSPLDELRFDSCSFIQPEAITFGILPSRLAVRHLVISNSS